MVKIPDHNIKLELNKQVQNREIEDLVKRSNELGVSLNKTQHFKSIEYCDVNLPTNRKGIWINEVRFDNYQFKLIKNKTVK